MSMHKNSATDTILNVEIVLSSQNQNFLQKKERVPALRVTQEYPSLSHQSEATLGDKRLVDQNRRL